MPSSNDDLTDFVYNLNGLVTLGRRAVNPKDPEPDEVGELIRMRLQQLSDQQYKLFEIIENLRIENHLLVQSFQQLRDDPPLSGEGASNFAMAVLDQIDRQRIATGGSDDTE